MIGAVADGIVNVVRTGHRQRKWLSALALLVALVVGLGYLLFGALQVNPFKSVHRLTVQLPASGGLLANQPVTLRGNPIGRIESLTVAPTGIDAHIRVDSAVKLSEDTGVRVTGLSAAGEQYIDFDGGSGNGPFLADGGTIELGRATVPVTLAQFLAHADGTLKQVDPAKIEVLKKELSLTDKGPQKLTDIVDGGTFLLSTLDSVLPETTDLIKSSKVVLNLVSDKTAGIHAASANLGSTLAGVDRMRGGFRAFTQQTPATLSAVDNLFTDNSDTMVQLLGSLASTSQLLYLRVPAINALFPSYRTSALDALGSTMHDHGLWTTADIYPRYACDYGTPRRPPSSADFPEPYLYT